MAIRRTGLAALGALMADQALKALLKDARRPLIPGILAARRAQPRRVLGFLSGHPEAVIWLTLGLILAAGALLRRFHLKGVGALGAGLLMGGALGNLLDRLVYGAVVDYLQTLFMDFPVFNLADVCIILGAGLILIEAFFTRDGRAA